MAESTLVLTFSDLQKIVGRFLGYGITPGNWTSAQTDEIADIIRDGLAQFYGAHDWSFLRPLNTIMLWADIPVGSATITGGEYNESAGTTPVTASAATFYPSMVGASVVFTTSGSFTIVEYTSSTVVTVSGDASTVAAETFAMTATGDYALPDEFDGTEGQCTFVETSSYSPMRVMPEQQIRNLRQQMGASTGTPQMYAVIALSTTGSAGQRWGLMVWPIAASATSITYRGRILPGRMTSSLLYALGGASHSQTIRMGCLVQAELARDETLGVHAQEYQRLLEISIQHDVDVSVPDILGYNGDASDSRCRGEPQGTTLVTYNGAT